MTTEIRTLDRCQRSLETLLLDIAMGKNSRLLERCKEVVNEVGAMLSTEMENRDTVVKVAQDVLALYDKIKTRENRAMTLNEKVKWIASKVNGIVLPPLFMDLVVIDNFSSYSEMRLPLPSSLAGLSWIRLNQMKIDWSTNGLLDLYQDLSPNCSFVASLISITNHGGIDLRASITPNSESYKYGVKLYINGYPRLVIVDDLVPVVPGKPDSTLFVKSASSNHMLWPAILEKAYFKLLKNGYDHQGSNFGIDTYMLTGWIPSYSHINELTDDKLENYYKAFKDGVLLLGIGAGKLTREESAFYGIVSNHDYSIQDINKLEDNSFSLKIKNPLSNGKKRVLQITNLQLFDIIYVNTNPDIYKYTEKVEFLHQIPDLDNHTHFFAPQFTLTNITGSDMEICLFVERHLLENDEELDTFLNVNVYSSNGERIWGNQHRKIFKGYENNTRYHQCRFTLTDKKCTVVISHSSKSSRLRSFTLRLFSNCPLKIAKSQNKYKQLAELKQSWDLTNSFGNPSFRDYIKNPQYELIFPSRTSKNIDVTIALFSNRVRLSLGIFTQNSSDIKFLTSFDEKDLIVSHNTYVEGTIIYPNLQLITNTKYILILSTYEPVKHQTPYRIMVNYDEEKLGEAKLTQINNRLGLFVKQLKFSWKGLTQYKFKFDITMRSYIQLRLCSDSLKISDLKPLLKVSILTLDKQFLKQSEKSEFEYGLFMSATLNKGSYVILVEKFNDLNVDCQVELGADNKFLLEHYQ